MTRFHSGRILLAAFLLPVLLAACTPAPEGGDGDRLLLFVSIPPQRYFVERVGGEWVEVMVMVGPGDNPATYEPDPAQLRALSGAAAYFTIGVPFEDVWLDRIAEANPDMVIVDSISGIERMPMPARPGEEGGGAPDPHVWLSPRLVEVQAQTIYEALVELDPAHQAEYAANLEAFTADIDQLEADIQGALAGLENRKFIVFHPSWGYFARDFGLEQIPIEVGGQEPSARELAHLIEVARAEGIRVVLAQPEFSTEDAETIAREIGGEVVLVSPLDPDWMENMRRVARVLAESLGE